MRNINKCRPTIKQPVEDIKPLNTNTNSSHLPLILQLSDSAFPTGCFAHSLGCESSIQKNFANDDRSLQTFIACNLENTGSNNLPFVIEAYSHWSDFVYLAKLDNLYRRTHSNHVTYRASKQMGRSLSHTCHNLFPKSTLFNQMEEMMKKGFIEGFQEIQFGAMCAALGLSCQEALQLFMFGTLRMMINSVVRLGKILGPMKAQVMQLNLQAIIPAIISRNSKRKANEVCIKYPLVEIIQNSHDALYSRMFYS